MIESATVLELVDLAAGILIAVFAIHAGRKFQFVIFRHGWNVVAGSGILMALSSLFRAYYTYASMYELIPWGRAMLVVCRLTLVAGIYMLARAALRLWAEEGGK